MSGRFSRLTARVLLFPIFVSGFCLSAFLHAPHVLAADQMSMSDESVAIRNTFISADEAEDQFQQALCCTAFRMNHAKEKALIAPFSITFSDPSTHIPQTSFSLHINHKPASHFFERPFSNSSTILTGNVIKRE